MQGKGPQRIIGAKLKPLIATWAPVKEALNVTGFQAIAFVEQMCERLEVLLYKEDEITGLWMPCGNQSRVMLQKLGCSDYAQSVANDEVPTEPGKWGSYLCVTDADFQAIVDAANETSRDGGEPAIESGREEAESAEAIATLAEARRRDEHASIDKDAERRVLEIKCEMLRAEYAEMLAEHAWRIQELACEAPRVLARMICEAALGIPSEKNFLCLTDKDREVFMRLYPDLPSQILADLTNKENRPQGVERPPLPCVHGFVKLRDWIEHYTSFREIPGWKFTSAENTRIMHTFFDYHESSFGNDVGNATQLVYNGVPLYEHNESTGQYIAIPFTHEDYVYLAKKGEHCDYGPTASFPYWAKKYYVYREHLDQHRIFFSGVEIGDKPEKVATLRDSFRRHIGFDAASKAVSARAHRTKMMGILERVLEHFYGKDFDPNRVPKQEVVVPWIRAEFTGTSVADAKAIDAVTRPDAARNKR